MSPRSKVHLCDAREAQVIILSSADGLDAQQFHASLLLRSAVERQLEILRETPNQFRQTEPKIAAIKTDNFVEYNYIGVFVMFESILTPILALVGGLVGGYLTQITGGWVAERREDRRLLREARVAVERWVATQMGPMGMSYPGIAPQDMVPIETAAVEEFFRRHFNETFEAKAALGAVRRFDERLGRILDMNRWDIPMENIGEIRDALTRAERRASLIRRETPSYNIEPHSR